MNDTIPEDQLLAIRDALFSGRKIEAIRIYRMHTNTGLHEAKTAMDMLESEMRKASPEMFVAQGNRVGCLGVIAVMLAIPAVLRMIAG